MVFTEHGLGLIIIMIIMTAPVESAQGILFIRVWKREEEELNFLQSQPHDETFTMCIVVGAGHSLHHFLLFKHQQLIETNKSTSFYEILFRNYVISI